MQNDDARGGQAMSDGETVALLDALGGASGLAALVARLYRYIYVDPRLAAHFAASDTEALERHQSELLSVVLSGGDHDREALRAAHAGRGIGAGDVDRLLIHLGAALTDLGVAAGVRARVLAAVDALRDDVLAGT